MARIVLGNREGLLAIRQGRSVLERLTEEWPDVHLTLRTVSKTGPLLDALVRGDVGVAVVQLDTLPLELPEGLVLAAVTRRGEPRTALAARGKTDFAQLPAAARIAVSSERDAAFLAAAHEGLQAGVSHDAPDALLAQLASGDYDALLLPALTLITLDLRSAIDSVLDENAFTPAPGQGAIGLVVREGDDAAFEAAYSLQHRPSFDRVRAERAFAAGLEGRHVGALASVTDDGELTLFGSVVENGTTVQVTTGGEAHEAEELGRELAHDVLAHLTAL